MCLYYVTSIFIHPHFQTTLDHSHHYGRFENSSNVARRHHAKIKNCNTGTMSLQLLDKSFLWVICVCSVVEDKVKQQCLLLSPCVNVIRPTTETTAFVSNRVSTCSAAVAGLVNRTHMFTDKSTVTLPLYWEGEVSECAPTLPCDTQARTDVSWTCSWQCSSADVVSSGADKVTTGNRNGVLTESLLKYYVYHKMRIFWGKHAVYHNIYNL